MSHNTMLMVAMLAYAVRVYAYTLLDEDTVWCVLSRVTCKFESDQCIPTRDAFS